MDAPPDSPETVAKRKPGTTGKGVVNVWLITLDWTALPPLFFTFLRHGRYNLRFTRTRRGCVAVAKLLWLLRVLNAPADRVPLTERGIQVDTAETPWLQIHGRVNEFTNRFFSIHRRLLEKSPHPDRRIRRDRIQVNLRKVVANDTYQLLTFLEFTRDWHQANDVPVGRLVVMSPQAGLAGAVPDGWAGDNLKFISLWSQANSWTLHLLRNVLTFLTQSIRRRKLRPDSPPSIGVAISEGFNRSARLNDLSWWWESGIPSDRVVLIFDRADSPATHEVMALAEQQGFRCVVSDRRAIGDAPHLFWKAAPGAAVRVQRLWRTTRIWAWGIGRGSVARWIACRLLTDGQNSSQIEDLLTDFNLRGLFHHQDVTSDHYSLACDAAGAARIGHHWSDMFLPMAYHARLNQVYFVWGARSAALVAAVGSKTEHVLLSGCVVGGAHPGVKSNEEIMRQRDLLHENGASRILALFDTSLPCDGFYDYFLRQVINDGRWGLLIKPKGRATAPWFDAEKPQFIELYREAEATGRVITIGHLISPAETAAAADFSVAVGINSAATVAALAGNRAIHMDYVRLHENPFSDWAIYHKDGADQTVFDDQEKLWASLNRYFDEPGQEANLGLMDENLLRYIDPFRDGNAGKRIGEYVRWYLEGLDQNMDRDTALAEATRLYGEEWGQRSISPNLEQNLSKTR